MHEVLLFVNSFKKKTKKKRINSIEVCQCQNKYCMLQDQQYASNYVDYFTTDFTASSQHEIM